MAKAKVEVEVETVLDVPVQFSAVGIGEDTARVGVKMERKTLRLTKADAVLCGHRITGKIVVTDGQSADDQGKLEGMEDCDVIAGVEGTFDVKSIRASAKYIGCSLTFSLPDVDVGVLAKFAKRTGRLTITEVCPLEDKGKKAPEEDNEE